MLTGAMRELSVGNPDRLSIDVGPVIDLDAKRDIDAHVAAMREKGRKLEQLPMPEGGAQGTFVPPTLIELDNIDELTREVFGPVLHVVRYRRSQLDKLLEQIRSTGYGLTLGIQTRIDETIAHVIGRANIDMNPMNMNLVGKWGNQYGSALEIHDCDADGSFQGIYRSDTGASGIYPMNGYAYGGTGASQPISLSVFWRPADRQIFDPSWHWVSVMTGTLFLDEPITGQLQLLHGLVASSSHEAVDIYGPAIYTESLTFSPLSERLPEGESFSFGTAENKVSVEWLNACPDSPFRALSYTYDDAGLVTGTLTRQDLTSVRVQGFTDPNPRERLQSIALTALFTDRNGRACAIGMGGFIDRQSNTAKIERFSSSAVSYANRYSGVAVAHERFAVTTHLL